MIRFQPVPSSRPVTAGGTAGVSAGVFGRSRRAAALLAGVALCGGVLALSPAQAASVGDRTGVAMTLYQTGPALIEEQRAVQLDKGDSTLTFGNVSSGLIPPSVRVIPVSGPSFAVREQAWRPARPLMQDLLRASEGKAITLIRQVDGKEVQEQAKVLRAEPEPVLEINGKIRLGLPGAVLFDSLPPDLPLTPALTVSADAASAGAGVVALRYLSGGLVWSADHVIDLSADGKSAQLTTAATLSNTTHQPWNAVKLALVAGQVEASAADMMPPPRPAPMAVMSAAPMMEKRAALPEREAFGNVYLYTVDRPVSLAPDETRQITLLRADALPAKTVYVVTGAGSRDSGDEAAVPQAVPSFLTVTNSGKGGTGQPVPGGAVRLYQSDSKGQARLLGSTQLNDLPVDGSARLPLGAAFDLTASGRMTGLTRISDRTQETSHEIVLHNAKASAETVEVVEPMGGDWKITAESMPGKRLDGSAAVWSMPVPAGKSVTLTYTVRTTY